MTNILAVGEEDRPKRARGANIDIERRTGGEVKRAERNAATQKHL